MKAQYQKKFSQFETVFKVSDNDYVN
jgi:hypothetical protein